MAAGPGLDLPPFPGPARFRIEKHMVDDDTPESYLQGIPSKHGFGRVSERSRTPEILRQSPPARVKEPLRRQQPSRR